jgi:hypothetical protein
MSNVQILSHINSLWCFYIGSCQVTFLVSSSKSSHLQTSFSARNSCLVAVDDVNEGRLQAGTTDKETVNVGLLSKLLAVLLGDTATVQDAGLLGSLGGDLLLQPLTEGGVDFLCLLGGRDLAGTDGPGCMSVIGRMLKDGGRDSPDGLVGNDNLAPVLDLVGNSLKLLGNDLDGVTRLALLQSLTAAQNDTEATVYRRLCLARSEVVALLEDLAALRVADEGPGDAAVLQLVGRDLTGESTVGLVEDVLCGDFETLAEVLACKEEVEGWWCDDDLYAELANCFCGGLTEDFRSPDTFQKGQIGHTDILVELGLVEVVDDIGDRLDRTVPLELLAPSAVLQVLTA